MAESIAMARARLGGDAIILHVNGAFHSDFGLGTAARVRRRLPGAKTLVLSAIPHDSPENADVTELLSRGDYLLVTKRIKK
jgi:uncharacterized iron-regulated protein